MKRHIAAAALVSSGLLIIAGHPINASFMAARSPDVERLQRFVGEWSVRPGADDVIENAVRRATESMSAFTRGVARGRLLKENAPPARIRMQHRDEVFTIEFEGGASLALPISGEPLQRGNLSVRLDLQGVATDVLRQIGQTNEGTRENLYHIDSATQDLMTMDVTMTTPRVPAPVRYALGFTRSSAADATRRVSRIR